LHLRGKFLFGRDLKGGGALDEGSPRREEDEVIGVGGDTGIEDEQALGMFDDEAVDGKPGGVAAIEQGVEEATCALAFADEPVLGDFYFAGRDGMDFHKVLSKI